MFDINILTVFMIAAALVAVETRDNLSSIIALGAVGLAQSLGFLVLKAPDLAIIQLVIEILSLVILLRATVKRTKPDEKERRDWLSMLIGAALTAIILSFAWRAVKDLPAFGFPIMDVAQEYIRKGFTETGATNLVSSVILNYRALDALGEVVLLFAAVMGSLAVLRLVGRKHAGGQGGGR